jgi:hypothetical protein
VVPARVREVAAEARLVQAAAGLAGSAARVLPGLGRVGPASAPLSAQVESKLAAGLARDWAVAADLELA